MSNDLITAEYALSTGSLSSYISWVHTIPMLTADEEHQLAVKLKKLNDLESARKLIMSHLRLVTKIARGYLGYGLAEADLIQEGNIGLMKAVKRFDPDVGVRLVSFAIHWIRAEIHDFVIKNWRIVKIATTKAQRKLFFNLRKKAKSRGWFSASEAQTIADELNVSKKEVLQMEVRLNSHDQSFESFAADTEQDWKAPERQLEDRRYDPAHLLEHSDWSSQQNQQLASALQQLDSRSQDILQQRWLKEKKATLHDLAAQYNISAERVRQLEKSAFAKLRGLLSIC